jgi:hypothetical protein
MRSTFEPERKGVVESGFELIKYGVDFGLTSGQEVCTIGEIEYGSRFWPLAMSALCIRRRSEGGGR